MDDGIGMVILRLWAILFLVLAGASAILAYRDLSSRFAAAARFLLFIFLAVFLTFFILGILIRP